MLQSQTRHKWTIPVLVILLLLLLFAALMASGQQVSLPLTGLQSNRQTMPPDPNEWCGKVDLEKLNNEMMKAETFMREGMGENLVDWRYLRRALKATGVQVNGPEDTYWLETIKELYAGCR
ncbi:MAG: hypothetical protein IPM53_25180 [Anaerolineaceae bacterium]|nr:hypothetical protein [Anaerolineaceae bacterium]